jgi:hypothetical protein
MVNEHQLGVIIDYIARLKPAWGWQIGQALGEKLVITDDLFNEFFLFRIVFLAYLEAELGAKISNNSVADRNPQILHVV